MMPLLLAEIGEENIIKKVGGSPEVKRHLENLGFVVGGTASEAEIAEIEDFFEGISAEELLNMPTEKLQELCRIVCVRYSYIPESKVKNKIRKYLRVIGREIEF